MTFTSTTSNRSQTRTGQYSSQPVVPQTYHLPPHKTIKPWAIYELAPSHTCRPGSASVLQCQGKAVCEAAGPVPQVQISIGNAEQQYYCQGQELTSLQQGTTSDGLVQLTVPLSDFQCDLSRVDQVCQSPWLSGSDARC